MSEYKLSDGPKLWWQLWPVILVAIFMVTPLALAAQSTLYLNPQKTVDGQKVFYTAEKAIILSPGTSFIVQEGGYASLKAGSRIELHHGFKVLDNGRVTVVAENLKSSEVSDEKSLFRVFPVPASEVVNITGPLVIDIIRLTDLNGFTVIEQQESGRPNVSLDLSSLKRGLYIMEIVTGSVSEKVRIEKK